MLVDAVESLFQFHKRPKGERPQREEARGGQLWKRGPQGILTCTISSLQVNEKNSTANIVKWLHKSWDMKHKCM